MGAFVTATMLCSRRAPWRAQAADKEACYPFFAFQNGMVGVPVKEQPKLLERVGLRWHEFEGPPKQVPEMLKALDAQGLKMFCDLYRRFTSMRTSRPMTPA